MLLISIVSAYWAVSSLVLMITAITSKSSAWIRIGYALLSVWGAGFFVGEVLFFILFQGVS
jgi:hypothetical protein